MSKKLYVSIVDASTRKSEGHMVVSNLSAKEVFQLLRRADEDAMVKRLSSRRRNGRAK